jgi:predicted phosphodiesterase
MIGIIGDMHMRDNLSYADHIQDGRVGERKEVLDFIVESFKDCKHIVFMGDNFNSRNNSSETNRMFVEFLERFNEDDKLISKDIYILAGNHEKKGDGKTAIDFIGEIDKPNWHVFTKPDAMELGKLKVDFLPYMLNSEIGVETSEEATKEIMKHLANDYDILFAHHSISGTSFNGIKTDTLSEVVLPKAKLEKKYKLIVAGHIHVPQQYGKILITGSVFTDTVNEVEKFIWKIDKDLNIEKIKLPCREIHKLENPTLGHLTGLPKSSIVKIVLTDKKISAEEMKAVAEGFDAHLIIEDYPDTRKKAHIEEGAAFDFSITALLKLYSEEKKIDYQKLLKGFELINNV